MGHGLENLAISICSKILIKDRRSFAIVKKTNKAISGRR
jgi:hypothetical protein